MSLRVNIVSRLSVVETQEGVFVNPADATLTFDQLSTDETLTAATSTPVTKHSEFDKALVAGAGTINLAALPGKTPDEVINATGLKVQSLKLTAPASNANPIAVSVGASNGHTLFGSSWTFEVKPGQEFLFKFKEGAPDVASGNRTIDLAGTGTQVLKVAIVLG